MLGRAGDLFGEILLRPAFNWSLRTLVRAFRYLPANQQTTGSQKIRRSPKKWFLVSLGVPPKHGFPFKKTRLIIYYPPCFMAFRFPPFNALCFAKLFSELAKAKVLAIHPRFEAGAMFGVREYCGWTQFSSNPKLPMKRESPRKPISHQLGWMKPYILGLDLSMHRDWGRLWDDLPFLPALILERIQKDYLRRGYLLTNIGAFCFLHIKRPVKKRRQERRTHTS